MALTLLTLIFVRTLLTPTISNPRITEPSDYRSFGLSSSARSRHTVLVTHSYRASAVCSNAQRDTEIVSGSPHQSSWLILMGSPPTWHQMHVVWWVGKAGRFRPVSRDISEMVLDRKGHSCKEVLHDPSNGTIFSDLGWPLITPNHLIL